MTETKFDVVGIGNAIVDILAYTSEAFLKEHQLPLSSMQLIDEKTAQALYLDMGAATECSGGSAGNTLAGLASLGGKAAFIGKVKDDQFGEIFEHDMKSQGVHFETPKAKDGLSTAHCLVFVTSDGEGELPGQARDAERTMATFLGASTNITEADIDEEVIKAAKVTYIEGYLFDAPAAQIAIEKAIAIAHAAGRKTALALSDAFCVDRHRETFMRLISDGSIDLVFANEAEVKSLFEKEDLNTILSRLGKLVEVAVVTRSEKGSYIVTDDGTQIHTIEAERISAVYDVTGAGDLYASGVLYGYTNGMNWEDAGTLGAKCATEVIKYIGGRPLSELSDLLEK
jgi:sugar/nucleoside kinase (ribokinase family)